MSDLNLQFHSYLFSLALISFVMVFIYIFICKHRKDIDLLSERGIWYQLYTKVGLKEESIYYITHDEDVWYYKDKSTCVAYGESEKSCPRYESYCSGGNNSTFGTPEQQVNAVLQSINSTNHQHTDCPLIYTGAL